MTDPTIPRVLRSFRIYGLHGHKNVFLDFKDRARIVIAENGMGKTTILSALQAFLSANFFKLQSLPFDSIECHLTTADDPLVLSRKDLPNLLDPVAADRLDDLARFTGADLNELQNSIFHAHISDEFELRANPVFREIYLESPLSGEQMIDYLSTIQSAMRKTSSAELQELSRRIKTVTKDHGILYLPTYRRIEIPFKRTPKDIHSRYSIYLRRFEGQDKRDYTDLGIQFGLSDVSERLTELFETIQRHSNDGYRSISANIIDDLLVGDTEDQVKTSGQQMPDIDDLERFFSRVSTANSPVDRFQSLRDLYESRKIDDDENDNLRYFLTKLATVVEETKELEANIEAFVDKANSYLRTSSDEKNLEYDSNHMKLLVRNSLTDEEIDLDDLSSGEKQVISLMANLYLFDEQQIVLIDEPELSLSIDWQKRLLPDVLSSPNCSQLLAITHSPFIFDNDLDPFAGPLMIQRLTDRQGEVRPDDR